MAVRPCLLLEPAAARPPTTIIPAAGPSAATSRHCGGRRTAGSESAGASRPPGAGAVSPALARGGGGAFCAPPDTGAARIGRLAAGGRREPEATASSPGRASASARPCRRPGTHAIASPRAAHLPSPLRVFGPVARTGRPRRATTAGRDRRSRAHVARCDRRPRCRRRGGGARRRSRRAGADKRRRERARAGGAGVASDLAAAGQREPDVTASSSALARRRVSVAQASVHIGVHQVHLVRARTMLHSKRILLKRILIKAHSALKRLCACFLSYVKVQ